MAEYDYCSPLCGLYGTQFQVFDAIISFCFSSTRDAFKRVKKNETCPFDNQVQINQSTVSISC
jgi:hypothetical protein